MTPQDVHAACPGPPSSFCHLADSQDQGDNGQPPEGHRGEGPAGVPIADRDCGGGWPR